MSEDTVAVREDGGEDERAQWELERQTQRRALSMPHLAAAGVAAAGHTAWAAAELAAHSGASGLAVTAATGLGAAAASAFLRWAKHDAIGCQWAKRYWLAAATGAAWATTASVTGVGPGMWAALIAGEAALAAGWWRHHRRPVTDLIASDTPRPGTGLVPVGDAFTRKWADRVASGRRAQLPDSELTDPQPLANGNGTRYTLWLDGNTYSDVLNNISRVASLLQVPATELIVERWPDGREDRLSLRRVTHSPIKDTIICDGPRWCGLGDGFEGVRLGPFADGDGAAAVRVYMEGSGMLPAHFAGGQGSGKTGTMNLFGVSLRASGKTTLVYLDGAEHGGSSKMLRHHADWAETGQAGGLRILAAAEQWLEWRQQENVHLGVDFFTPSPERPGIAITIDEAHEVFKDPAVAARWERVIRFGRKYGIGVYTASQGLGVKDFGSNRDLRKLLVQWNLFVFRIAANTEGSLVPGLDLNPANLPTLPGYGIAACTTDGYRAAPFRSEHNPQWESLMAPLPKVPLDAFAVAAADVADNNARYYSRRHEIHKAALARTSQNIAALLAGTWKPTAVTPAVSPSADSAAAVPGPLGDLHHMLDAIPAPSFGRGSVSMLAERRLTDSQRRVYDAIRRGALAPQQQMDATGYGETHVRNLRNELIDLGLVRKDKFGTYEPTASQPAAAQPTG